MIACVITECDWKTLAAIRLSSRQCFALVGRHLRARYTAHISPYVTDHATFNDILRAHGAIISGTVALHFFIPDTTWTPRELDIYVPATFYEPFLQCATNPLLLGWKRVTGFRAARHAAARYRNVFRFVGAGVEESDAERDEFLTDLHVASYPATNARPSDLEESEPVIGIENRPDALAPDLHQGIELFHPPHHHAPHSRSDALGSDSEEGDGTFFSPSDYLVTDSYQSLQSYSPRFPSLLHSKGFRTMRSYRTDTNRRVNVVCSHSINPVSPLRHFWTSLMTNFLTPDACVCGFPSATLQRSAVTRLYQPLSLRECTALEQYTQRGFAFDQDGLRSTLDPWDYMFVGEKRLLALYFREHPREPVGRLPIRHTPRGWIADDQWKRNSSGKHQSARDTISLTLTSPAYANH